MNNPRFPSQQARLCTFLRKTPFLSCLAVLAAACAARPAPSASATTTQSSATTMSTQPDAAPTRPTANAGILLTGIAIDRFNEIDAALDAAWQKLNPAGDMTWTPARTPFFSSQQWPTPKTTWTSYVFAYGRKVSGLLADGRHVAQPWAAITYDAASNSLSLATLSTTLVDTGEIQGVRPLNDAEIALLKRAPEVQQWVLTHPEWPQWNDELRAIQQFYLTWLATNGVIGARITPAHDDFVNKWVYVSVN
jgi:hypothetical protein